MSHRMDQINKEIQRVFGELLVTEVDLPLDVLVTVAAVETARNLQRTTIWLSVLPTGKSGTVLKLIRKQMYSLQGVFNRRMHMKPLPRISFKIDRGAEYADSLEGAFRKIEDED